VTVKRQSLARLFLTWISLDHMDTISDERAPYRGLMFSPRVSRNAPVWDMMTPPLSAFGHLEFDLSWKRRTYPALSSQNGEYSQRPEAMNTARKRKSDGHLFENVDTPGKRQRQWQDAYTEMNRQSTCSITKTTANTISNGESGDTEIALPSQDTGDPSFSSLEDVVPPYEEANPYKNATTKLAQCHTEDGLRPSLRATAHKSKRNDIGSPTTAIYDFPPTAAVPPDFRYTCQHDPGITLTNSSYHEALETLNAITVDSESNGSPSKTPQVDMAVPGAGAKRTFTAVWAGRLGINQDVLSNFTEEVKARVLSNFTEGLKAKFRGNHWCDTCGANASNIKAMEEHAARSARDKFTACQPFKCSKTDCGFRSAKYDTYYRHMRQSHKSKKAFECEFCERKGIDGFNRKQDLEAHMKAWHPQEWDRLQKEYPKYCTETGCMHAQTMWAFKTEAKYLSHMRKEHGHGKLDCTQPGCSRRGKNGYSRESDLVAHCARDHP
jgi:uncharacterized short protein YbdD (DUF466 family)